jgi:hypothetical protein
VVAKKNNSRKGGDIFEVMVELKKNPAENLPRDSFCSINRNTFNVPQLFVSIDIQGLIKIICIN